MKKLSSSAAPAQVRPGPGKPALYGSPMKRINVMLDENTVETLKALGDGNLSAGIRLACSVAHDAFQASVASGPVD